MCNSRGIPFGLKCCVEGTLGIFMTASFFPSAVSFAFLFANRDSDPARFSAASFDPLLIVFTLPCDDGSMPLDPSLGGAGGFEDDCRRWCPRDEAKHCDEAAIEGDDARGDIEQDGGQTRATRRREEDIISEGSPRCCPDVTTLCSVAWGRGEQSVVVVE